MPEPRAPGRSLAERKRALRERMLRLRRAFPPDARAAASEAICRSLLQDPLFLRSRTVLAYAAMPEEVQIDAVLAECLARGVRLAIPWIPDKGRMEAALVPSMDALEAGAYGIRTVPGALRQLVPGGEIDCVLAPGAAFSRKGERLGLGGGYYDRFLARAPRALRVAVAFSFQVLDSLPSAPHDLPVDRILTELGIIDIKGPCRRPGEADGVGCPEERT